MYALLVASAVVLAATTEIAKAALTIKRNSHKAVK